MGFSVFLPYSASHLCPSYNHHNNYDHNSCSYNSICSPNSRPNSCPDSGSNLCSSDICSSNLCSSDLCPSILCSSNLCSPNLSYSCIHPSYPSSSCLQPSSIQTG